MGPHLFCFFRRRKKGVKGDLKFICDGLSAPNELAEVVRNRVGI